MEQVEFEKLSVRGGRGGRTVVTGLGYRFVLFGVLPIV